MLVYVTKRIGGASGSSKSANDVANALCELKVGFEIVSEHPFKYFDHGKIVNRLKRDSSLERSSSTIIKFIKDFENYFRKRKISFADDRIILVNSYIPHIFERVSCVGSWVNIVRGSPESFKNGNNPYITLSQFVEYLNRFDQLIFLSGSLLEDWRPYLSDGIKYDIISNTVQDIKPQKTIIGDNNRIRIVCIGSIQKRKGQDVLLAAAKLIHDYEVEITLIGGFEPTYKEEFNKRVEEVKSIPNISINLTGHVNDPTLYISSEDIFVLPTRAEALPRSVIEAMAMQLPIITTNVDGNRDLIKDGHNGLLIEPNDPAELARKIVFAHENPELKKSLAARARSVFQENYSRPAYVNNWRKFLRKYNSK